MIVLISEKYNFQVFALQLLIQVLHEEVQFVELDWIEKLLSKAIYQVCNDAAYATLVHAESN